MPIFTQSLQRIDESNPKEAIKKMANHIKYIQEQLEYTLFNLDSRHIKEIDTDSTTITGNVANTGVGSFINFTGKNGESFTAGVNASGQFVFDIRGKDGKQTIYLSSSGELRITENTNLTINGGDW